MLINLTNHPSSAWLEKQLKTAVSLYGNVVDYSFPAVAPEWTEEDVDNEADSVVSDILNTYSDEELVIHVMGEFTLCYSLIKKFKAHGITCVASTTSRIVTENADGTKTSTFNFIRFREYR